MSPVCRNEEEEEMEEDLYNMINTYHKIKEFSELYLNITAGNLQTVQKMIKAGADLNRREVKNSVTPIFAAIRYEEVQMVEELIHAGANVNVYFPTYKATPLGVAISTNNAEIVNLLLDNGADFLKTLKDYSALHYCATTGRVEMADLLIKRGLEVDIRNKRNQTPLHLAVETGETQMVQFLIAKGANVSAMFNFTKKKEDEVNGWFNVTPLCCAAELGHCEIADMLIVAGANVNEKASGNFTPLHLAIKRGRTKFVDILLKAGAKSSVNIPLSRDGITPLSLAAILGHVDIVKALLKIEGIEIEAVPATKETPLAAATRFGHLEVVKMLLANGALVNGRTDTVATPLHIALRKGKNDVAKVLIENGADIHAADEDKLMPLHIACENDVSIDVIKLLVEKGAKLDARTSDGAMALHLAAKHQLETVECLLGFGADPSAVDEKNCIALEYALSSECVDIAVYLLSKLPNHYRMIYFLSVLLHVTVEKCDQAFVNILLKAGAKINSQDTYGYGCKPIHVALTDERLEIAELLFKHNALFVDLKEPIKGRTLLFCAVERQQEELVKLMLDEGADPNAVNKNGVLPIHVAAKLGNHNIVTALLAKGAYYDVTVNSKRYSGAPLCFARKAKNAKLINIIEMIKKLFKAVIENNLAQIELCIQAGVIVNARKRSGRTALHFAVSQDNADAVKMLLASGADITLSSNKSDSPLQIALANGCIEILEMLLTHAKNLGFVMYNSVIDVRTNKNGYTLMHIAVEINRFHMVKFLLKNGAMYNFKNNFDNTPLDLTTDEAIESLLISAEKLFEAVEEEDGLEKVKEILEDENCVVNAREAHFGSTPLYSALLEGRTDIAEVLLSKGADYCLATNDGWTPIHIAAHDGNVKILEALINRMRNDNIGKLNDFINAKTISGIAALHIASNSEVVKCLLQAGAVYDIRDNMDRTALELTPHDDVKMSLATVHEVFEDVEKGEIDTLNALKTKQFKAVTRTRNVQGQSLVQVALVNSHKKIASFLLNKLK